MIRLPNWDTQQPNIKFFSLDNEPGASIFADKLSLQLEPTCSMDP
jgi:hypothetical protein